MKLPFGWIVRFPKARSSYRALGGAGSSEEWLLRSSRETGLIGPMAERAGTALIEEAFFLDEGWSFPADDPNLNVQRLLPNQGCHHPPDTSPLDLDLITHSFALGTY